MEIAAPLGVPGLSRRACAGWLLLAALGPGRGAGATSTDGVPVVVEPADLAQVFARRVQRRIDLGPADRSRYAGLLHQALAAARVRVERAQWMVVVDRQPQAQRVMLWHVPVAGDPLLVGAAAASTGRPSGFEHFETPLGVFAHSLDNPDYRAEGTPNTLGIRGYGVRGMRVFDFGWVIARRGWAAGEQAMRLQMHATDPVVLEPRLGRRDSKGCIRIPASLNRLIDEYGLLDADYEAALQAGRRLWVLRPDRRPTPWSGRYLVVVDSALPAA